MQSWYFFGSIVNNRPLDFNPKYFNEELKGLKFKP